MSGLAKYLLSLGKRVGGSDVSANDYTEELIKNGAKIDFGNDTSDIANYDLVVYTDAINEKDIRLSKAISLLKPTMPRGQFLYEISKNFKTVIAVSGCHGKTTCSAMLTHIFAAA
ncbi:MAG: UDP-N-acetylmuramate--L-alanine ligase, partial [Clostridia bacterium]|nr:UDP-N-acetylmuramate--L-alanine ligase [Clostridia bacterium]